MFLQPIAYMVEMKEQLEITDLKGNKIGLMNVSLLNPEKEKLELLLRSRLRRVTRRARSTQRRMTSLWTAQTS